jgi:predicted lipoprotein with Yx(FWY)xxD motif
MNMRKNLSVIAIMLGLIVTVTAFYSCTDKDSNPGGPVLGKDINLSNNARFGNILTDATGNTLYFFSPDVQSPTICVADCAIEWPPFYKENPSVGTGLNPADFGVVTLSGGAKQTTYKNWRLYHFIKDTTPGTVLGEGLGNVWFVAKPDYTVMIGSGQLVGKDGVSYTTHYTPGIARFTQFFTDDRGVTLYTFTKDFNKKNNYTSQTDTVKNNVWPIFGGTQKLVLPSILKASEFDGITVFNKPQLVYRGNPVYKYGGDAGVPGSTKGVSVPTPGVWPILNDTLTTVAPPAL